MNPQFLLEKAGFNHHESRLYLLLLQHSVQSASQLARKTQTPRNTVRSALDRLCEKGVVNKILKRNTQFYWCTDVTKVVAYFEEKIRQNQSVIQELKDHLSVLNNLKGQKNFAPKVVLYEGEKGVIEAFNHSLYAGVKEILFLTSYRFMQSDRVRKNDLEFYIPMRIKKGIKMRVLSEKNEIALSFKEKAGQSLRQHKLVPAQIKIPGNIHIYGSFVMFFSSHDGENMATLIESPIMAQTMRTFFEFMWEKCG